MYLLDTNICIYLIKKTYPSLETKVKRTDPLEMSVSAVTVAELEYGIAKSMYPKENRETLVGFLSPFTVLPFTEADCEHFGILRAYLNQRGIPIGPYDLQIAAQCLSRKLILVTRNVQEFRRVPGLYLENWTE